MFSINIGGSQPGGSGSGGGGSIAVTDGTTTVAAVTTLDFASGATVTDGGGGTASVAVSGGGLLTFTVVVTPAQLADLNNTPVTLVAAPGAGNVVSPVAIFAQYGGDSLTSGATFTIGLTADYPGSSFGSNGLLATIAPVHGSQASVLAGAANFVSIVARDNEALLLGTNGAIGFWGALSDVTSIAGGAGYAVGDTGNFDNGNQTSADYVIDTVDGGGAVLTFHLGSGGNDYQDGAAVSAVNGGGQPGVGVGFGGNGVVTVNHLGTLTLNGVYAIVPAA